MFKKYLIFLLLVVLAACGGGSGAMTPPTPLEFPTPIPSPTPIRPNAKYVSLGDSIPYGLYATSIQTQAFPVIVAQDLKAQLINLAIPGEYSEGIIKDEVSKIPPGTQVITLLIGTNDELSCVCANTLDPAVQAKGINTPATVESTFAANMQAIGSALHNGFPGASIYVANLPNLANLPEWKEWASMEQRTALSNLNGTLNDTIDQMGFPVVDLHCVAGAYDPSNYYNNGIGPLGDVHPNTQGHAYYASIFYATITSELYESHACSYFTLQ